MTDWITGRHGTVLKKEVISISAQRDELGMVLNGWVPEMTYNICAKLKSGGTDVCLVRDLRKGEVEETLKCLISQLHN